MKKITQYLLSILTVICVGATFLPATASAANVVCPSTATSEFCSAAATPLTDSIRKGVNILLFALGAIAVIIIIIAAIRLVLSGGNASSVTGAKNAILYAVIGLIIAISAYAIVNFVISRF